MSHPFVLVQVQRTGLIKVSFSLFFRPSEVAEAFLELVQDESKNGAVMKVLRSGREYVDFPAARL